MAKKDEAAEETTVEVEMEQAEEAEQPITPEVDQSLVDSKIRSHIIAAMGVGLVPIPVFDVVAVVAVQLKQVHSLSKIYGVNYSENIAKTLILSLIAGILPMALGGGLASAIKFIPGFGSFAGAAGVSILAGALTYAVGRIFAAHFESGGTLMDFSPSKVRDKFRDQFKKGKEVATEMSDKDEPSGEASTAA